MQNKKKRTSSAILAFRAWAWFKVGKYGIDWLDPGAGAKQGAAESLTQVRLWVHMVPRPQVSRPSVMIYDCGLLGTMLRRREEGYIVETGTTKITKWSIGWLLEGPRGWPLQGLFPQSSRLRRADNGRKGATRQREI